MQNSFLHLHLHTEYSIVDGIVCIEPLIATAKEAKMQALAITDHCNLFAMVKFYKAAIAAGIKPIIGADVFIENTQNRKLPFRLVLLCQNHQGYKNLTRLISRAYQEGQQQAVPIISKAWLTPESCDGLIALSGAREGDIAQAILSNNLLQAKHALQFWAQLFPNRFYIELQRTQREQEESYLQAAVVLAREEEIPVVATNDVRFLQAEDFEAHEARVCINQGWTLEDQRRPKLYSPQQYFKSQTEMQELFSDLPEALENTIEIAMRCNLELTLGKNFLPQFPVPTGMTLEDYFDHAAKEGLEQRFLLLFNKASADFALKKMNYEQRLQMELDVIKKMGFTGYFLIVADFIRWAKQQKIPVGPGRGSGAGSLVAYALGITDLDPIAFDLLFERFLNPERVSMPDFDIDFCMEGRDRVIEYVAQKYGRGSVSQIITYGTMAAKAVIRDVGRVLGYPYGFVDQLAKLVPFELDMTLKRALQQEDRLLKRYQEEGEVKALIDLASKLEGITRNAGKHAGGVVIAPSLITDFSPLYCEPSGENLVTQFDKDDVEAVGLVKFDFLGLRTLTIIDWTVQAINKKRLAQDETELDILHIPLDDEKTFALLRSCMTTAIFQSESRVMKDLIKRLQPDCFNDIVDLGALVRPGPLQSGMMDDFMNRKHGRARVEYPHPKLESVLRSTNGVILYQEQVMQIAQVLAGYSLGKADLLRRAMGKKKPEEMTKQRAIFVDGSVQRGVSADVANHIFDLMEKFADYGFNRSHSAAYALITYQTAWLKAHYPAEFMAAVLSSDMDNTDKVVIFIEDCRNLGLKILPPDIRCGQYKFTVNAEGNIIYGLGAIKGIGEAAVENMIESRLEDGPFRDFFDFCQRVDTRKVNKRVLEALIRSGALDCFGVNRASLMASLSLGLTAAEQHARTHAVGQVDLFGGLSATDSEQINIQYVKVPPWNEETRLLGEKETLGLYLSGHPITRYERELKQLVTARIIDLRPTGDQTVIVAGLVVAIRVMTTKSGNRMAFITLDDRTARIDVVIFSDAYAKHQQLIEKDQLLIVEGEIAVDEFTSGHKMTSRKLFSIDQARELFAKTIALKIEEKKIDQNFLQLLQRTLQPFRGGKCPIFINYKNEDAASQIALGSDWLVFPRDQLLRELYQLCGNEGVIIGY